MKVTKTLLTALVPCVALLAGCGHNNDPIKGAKEHIRSLDLAHTWETERCNSTNLLLHLAHLKSYKTRYEFHGNKIKKSEQYFTTKDCQDLAVVVDYNGTYHKQNETDKDVYQLDRTYDSATVTPHNTLGENNLRDVKFCGESEWHANKPINVTPHAHETTCLNTQLPQAQFDIYHVENDHLFFGKGDKSSEGTRPTELDHDEIYRKL